MKKYNKHISIILLIMIFISGCIQEKSFQTEQTVKNSKKGCLYSDGSICNKVCCKTGDNCNNQTYSYKKCDILTGLWSGKKYKNPDCTDSCEIKKIEELNKESKEKNEQQKEIRKEPQEVSACSSGWKCKNLNYKGYQYPDCSWSILTYCSYGCGNGKCKTQPQICIPNEKRCSENDLQKCSFDGLKWETIQICEYECENKQCIQKSTNQTVTLTVSYVSDGDTISLSNGETVRLIGLNAPESGQTCSSEATDKLKEFVLGKEIFLEEDIDDKDRYGRLLRYVYVDDIFVNLEMVRLGFAHKYEYGSNTRYSTQFEQAENEAKENCRCIWQPCESRKEIPNYIKDQCIYITNFNSDAAGNDNYNLNDEYVIFGNKCSYPIEMAGWNVKDETASHLFTFPPFVFGGGTTFTLYTGTGTNTNSALYWGRTSGNYAAIWNNDGDTLFLRDGGGNLVLDYTY